MFVVGCSRFSINLTIKLATNNGLDFSIFDFGFLMGDCKMAEPTDYSDHLIFAGCPCCNTLLSTDVAKFIGCSAVVECLCIREEFCLKANTPAMPCITGTAEGFLCKLGFPCCSVGLKIPTILAKGTSQCFCLTSNLALPPDADTPFLIALYGAACAPKVGCCIKMKDAHPK